jgi:hypothetical protein
MYTLGNCVKLHTGIGVRSGRIDLARSAAAVRTDGCTWLAGSQCGELQYMRQVTIYGASRCPLVEKDERTVKQTNSANRHDSLAIESAFAKQVARALPDTVRPIALTRLLNW